MGQRSLVGYSLWGGKELDMTEQLHSLIELPELTQDWGNRLLEGTNRTLCTPGPRDHTETDPEQCLSVSCRCMCQEWLATGAEALDVAYLGMA